MMAAYPLTALLNLRVFREEKAMHEVRACERKLTRAKREVERAVERHRDYMEWLAGEETRRYDRIMDTRMSRDEVEDFKSGLLAIRAAEADFLERILKARQHREICETAVKEAKALLLKAQKSTMKIEVHKEKWLEKKRLEEERAQEREMEEFISPVVMPV